MIEWLHRDEYLVAACKPTGLLAVPGRGTDKADCLVTRVTDALGVPFVREVHRLDRDTSGVMVMAMDAATQRALSIAFARRRVDKRYIAVVRGVMREDEGTIDAPIRKDMDRKYVHIVDPVQGKPSVTHWRVLERLADTTRLELIPETGRSHQLRLHLAHVGRPIVGDPLYGHGQPPRLMLHAAYLAFDHPHTGGRLTIASACPF